MSKSITPDSIVFPPSTNTISVKVFNAFKHISLPSVPFLSSAPGSTADESTRPLEGPGKSFLLEHPSGRKVVFDLGIRKDVSTMAKTYREAVESGHVKIDFGPDVAETLVGGGLKLEDIEALIISHPHFDHVGNPTTFPSSTTLVFGPGALAHSRPGYPLNENAHFPDSDFHGREVVEIEFKDDAPTIGGLKAHDYFGDGSFYLLDAPGHCPGQVFGLARTTPDTFILFGADAAHHPAVIRPSTFVPLPSSLTSSVPTALKSCPADAPFLGMPHKDHSIHHDPARARETVDVLVAFDAQPDVFVILSHDGSMDPVEGKEGGIKFFPETANAWKEKGWKESARWRFLESGNCANRWE